MSFAQLRRSWYIFFYQIPFIPELLIQAADFALLRRAFLEKPMGLTNTKNMTEEDLEVFKYTFSQSGRDQWSCAVFFSYLTQGVRIIFRNNQCSN